MAVAISGTRRAFKELVDGTLRVQIDVDPECRRDFLRLFPDIDTRVALAPIKANAAAKDPAVKGGELAKLAGILCGDPEFQAWILDRFPTVAEQAPVGLEGAELAAHMVRTCCQITSRAQLDHDATAARIFHDNIRKPWSER